MAFVHARNSDEKHAGKVEVTVKILRGTDKALHVDDGVKTFWLPRSKIDVEHAGKDGFAIVYMPEWLAHEKGCL